MGVRPTRVVRILLAGAVGAFVALLFLVLRPDAPFERSQSAAVPSPRTTDVGGAAADARSAAGRPPSEDPRASSEVGVDAADVPVETDIVYYGIALNGGRAIWLDDVRIARVDLETPLTQERSHGGRLILPVDGRAALAAPANLDFEITTHGAPGC